MDLLTEKIDFGALTTLAQYYDIPLRCFTFPDFQLAPTLEKFERIMNRSIKDYNPFPNMEEDFTMSKLALVLGLIVNELVANWAPKGIVKGFTRKYLEDYAYRFVREEKWEFCSAVLALLVHGIVLFPNINNFVDHSAIEILLASNPVPFLLADFYNNFHTRLEKKGGTFLCYAPLLHVWMRTHMPQKRPFVSRNITWPRRFSSLSANFVQW